MRDGAKRDRVMRRAWAIARDGAGRFGGSTRSYLRKALRLAWDDASDIETAIYLGEFETDLNELSHPDQFADALRAAADYARASGMELDTAWEDCGAGRPWSIVARELDRAADQIEKALARG